MSQATLSDRPYTNSNLFSGHYLDERVQEREEWDCDDEARTALDELQSLYDLESGLVDGYKEDALIDNWIDEVLDVLGFGTNVETTLPGGGGYVDALLFEDATARRDAAEVYLRTEDTADLFERGVGLVEAKQWDADFTTRFSEQRPYRNASHQIKHYLERTPEEIQWGVLTNGRKWRLYGTNDYETQTYYEVDLPELLEHGDLEAFKYFYVFFRPGAFREISGTTFLDSVWSESETVAQELGEDLQDNVFTALRVLGRGFAETNDLDIDPDDDEELAALKEQSLVLLYRLMFVLYAESRGLIHPEGGDAVTEYEDNFSLNELRLEIHEEIGEVDDGFDTYSEHSTTMWSRLEDLFRLVDEGEESLGIPPYNGGLFNQENHEFLTNHQVSNRYLAEVIYRISTTENDEGRYVLADYADLDTRHLGSVYEGLLEHQFRIAPEDYAAVSDDGGQVWEPATEVSVADAVETVDAGGLYVVNDEGERKATGAYYTPDYVVTYIVEETVDPLIDEIRADLQEQGFETGTHEYLGAFYRRVLDLTILDPAMGSGHFLTRATEYLAQQVMEEVREIEEATAFDEQRVRRDVAKECIYGVDLNGMAVELAKLSMWLETLAADQPLAFLDHHLKAGNSLVGSDVTAVLSNGAEADDDGGQLTLQQSFARVREQTLDHVMDRVQELLEIDNETLEDIKSMEELYDEVRSDPFYQRLFELTNVHTAERFDLDVPEGAYERMAGAIDDEDKWADVREEGWFQSAQAMAEGEAFFHWELEFPEVFFDQDGEKRADAGFDAVIGNPPYVRQEQIKGATELFSEFEVYSPAADLYTYFIEQGYELLADENNLGYIVSNKFTKAEYGNPLRKFLASNTRLKTLCDFHDLPVFGPSVSAYPLIMSLKKSEPSSSNEVSIMKIDDLEFRRLRERVDENSVLIEQSQLSSESWSLSNPEAIELTNKINGIGEELDQYLSSEILRGILTGLNEAFIIGKDKYDKIVDNDLNSERFIVPLMKGHDADRYLSGFSDRYLIRVPSGWSKSASGRESEEDAWEWFASEYPGIADHLIEFRSDARSRYDRGECWWELRPCDYYDEFESEKIVYPEISDGPRFSLDIDAKYTNNKCFIIPVEDYELLGILNSSVGEFWARNKLSSVRGGYLEYRTVHLSEFPVPSGDEPKLSNAVENIIDLIAERRTLNLSLLDHFGSYSNGENLSNIGLTQPPEGVADSILNDTTNEQENLRIGTVEVVRETTTSLEIQLTARYKPDDELEYDTDQWGYTETELLPAVHISNLTKTEADLIEAFVPVAVDEAGGFANFRETATKTNSLIDRLRKLTLPAVDDICSGLKSYLETKERAEELNKEIENTDQLIDEIVYELYELSDKDIEIIEEAIIE
ncbi:N-6 DNA methylase [Natronolimnobius sp. AArcel1]|uniref:Eco57I restriction-modification methylase domain-containing protein n=1 Tax=Natronolimnobius sp. AArcel1 TaxID=1679093 RepID=UPI0013EDD0FC|nr:Eco57I restriction-modification methylase domain-containing protein [Natronolimnobius sp. AArcel1]NGM71046.1 N-6 DNA methylase [Natronolimnobius sp. AArcel1]